MHDKQFMRESLLQGAQAFQAGKMGRRSFLALCGMAGFASASVLAGRAEAAAGEIVMWNWGGQSEECHTSAIGNAFTAETGIPLKFDTSGPLQGKIKEMVDSGNVTADVCDGDLFDAVALGKTGHLEPIDYTVVDKAKTIDGYALEFGVSIILYGYAFMYDTQTYPDGAPSTWADFFDTTKFPGTRSLYKWANGSLEAALMADGVAKDALYPLDMDRALAKIKAIKADTIYWGSGAEAQQMIVNGEVSMGMVWQNRGRSIENDTNGRYKLVTNQAIAMPGAYIVPKGNPGGAAVMKFIATAQSVQAQLDLFACLGMTPTNPEAIAALAEADQPYSITSAANLPNVVMNDPTWWGENTDAAVNAFLAAIS
ncbi:extracellular solute-binding protein [Cypionkella sp.]|uniref:extracellular solute-binding protein n=1 Tax=Cypionkella sp. TaxID=2811411 RepID=UPI002726C17E|nr:extracellular solute-binding protein [Cypionkella sp.]MDO8983686.1 extracellular solute-binding protein [Cypionkella sp.]MDP2050079.1 extracellular solute-binding protein [Cypionkella sp.]